MSAADELLVTVDGHNALAVIIIRPGADPGTAYAQAVTNGISKQDMAMILRESARQWAGE